MTKLDSKFLKELIMEVMVGGLEVDVPKKFPNITNSFSYEEDKIPDKLKTAIVKTFKNLLDDTAIEQLMKIAGPADELDWKDFYAILLDQEAQLRQPALAAMRIVKDDNAEYSKAFDEILKKIMADKPVRKPEDVNPYGAPVEDIVARKSQPPPQYIREAFEILGLNAYETLKERLIRLSNFSISVMEGKPQGTSIRETFSNLIVLNALSKITRTLDSSSAGFKFEDFLGLLSSGIAIGEGLGASDDILGILSDSNGEFSQYSSAKFLNSWGAHQSISTMSMAMPGQSRPASFDDLVGFDIQAFDEDELKAAKKAYEKGETDKLIQAFEDAGVSPTLIKRIKKFDIPKYDPEADSSIQKKTTSILGKSPEVQQAAFDDIDYDNKTITYVIGVKLGKDAPTGSTSSKRAAPGKPIPVLAVKEIPVEKIDIHMVTIKRVKGQGVIKQGDLEVEEPGANISVGNSVNISGLGPGTRIGQLLLADSTESLVEKSNQAMNSVEENIPKIIKALANFSEKTKATLISGKEGDINETTKLYTEMFGLINAVLYGTDESPSKFAQETGFQAGVQTKGDKVVRRMAKKITP